MEQGVAGWEEVLVEECAAAALEEVELAASVEASQAATQVAECLAAVLPGVAARVTREEAGATMVEAPWVVQAATAVAPRTS